MCKETRPENHMNDQIDETLFPEPNGRFKKQIQFFLEIDKLKPVDRRTVLLDQSRQENSAEHSWHIALSVLLLSEYAQEGKIDFFHVIKMLLIHDLVEIDAGDTYCYDDKGREDQRQREQMAADRIFNLLPLDLAQSFRKLWNEFESRETAESKFANALDRFQPFLLNYFSKGRIWKKNKVKSGQVVVRMQPVRDGSQLLWRYVMALIDDAVSKGYLLK
jgi:putative hydrolase of HD superfamily